MYCCICLDPPHHPVIIPCGHIYCAPCMRRYIQHQNGQITSTCPKCRALFCSVTPDPAIVPSQRQPFVLPGVRPLFLDFSELAVLRAELRAAVISLKKKRKRIQQLRSSYTTCLHENQFYQSLIHSRPAREATILSADLNPPPQSRTTPRAAVSSHVNPPISCGICLEETLTQPLVIPCGRKTIVCPVMTSPTQI